ncbi:hypothetical protein CfE428DRAFT_5026 [Chthoniobacter flavus Ellin428]|uniref:Uncharacterized protein n=1 Tax=Chthoniobacter flavus Ellin428 TaxID=497964 RepID=B4D7Y6_9BACT|nr:hypothetical protein [Chthoniobacter flavus]EDY17509.1 hypothetical protein CfE428DRAFT_5026 [Chthoniobacter flavus Ellin428]TCO92304.1 hypothetical protein EV701_10673 [Chthoniobacter flavus]
MKTFRKIFLSLLAVTASFALPLHAADPLYKNDFESAEVGKVPSDMMVMAGAFEVKQDKDGKYLELPGEPLDTFGLLFGPAVKDDVSASARFFGTKKGRKMPAFGVSLNGAGGYRLQVSAAKGKLEFFKGVEAEATSGVPYTWASDTWTNLRITVRKDGDKWVIEGRAWAVGSPEPEKPLITLEEKNAPSNGKAGIWGSPFSGTPIKFDDLLVTPLK